MGARVIAGPFNDENVIQRALDVCFNITCTLLSKQKLFTFSLKE
jgi:hypothetical protein